METSGLDPEITICKIVVLPVKLCPLCLLFEVFINKQVKLKQNKIVVLPVKLCPLCFLVKDILNYLKLVKLFIILSKL